MVCLGFAEALHYISQSFCQIAFCGPLECICQSAWNCLTYQLLVQVVRARMYTYCTLAADCPCAA